MVHGRKCGSKGSAELSEGEGERSLIVEWLGSVDEMAVADRMQKV